MRMALVMAVALAGAAAVGGPPVSSAQTARPTACALSAEETERQTEAHRRLRHRGAPLGVTAQHTSPPTEGCGIWEVRVAPDGTVASADLSRGDFRGEYEAVVRPWLLTQRYRPSEQTWSALVVVRFMLAD